MIRLPPRTTLCPYTTLVRSVATASPAQRWLLVEQPGPWGMDALTQSRFDPAVAPRLAHRARVEGVRVLLVRRPGDRLDRKSTRLNSSHANISYAVFCLKKKR